MFWLNSGRKGYPCFACPARRRIPYVMQWSYFQTAPFMYLCLVESLNFQVFHISGETVEKPKQPSWMASFRKNRPPSLSKTIPSLRCFRPFPTVSAHMLNPRPFPPRRTHPEGHGDPEAGRNRMSPQKRLDRIPFAVLPW